MHARVEAARGKRNKVAASKVTQSNLSSFYLALSSSLVL